MASTRPRNGGMHRRHMQEADEHAPYGRTPAPQTRQPEDTDSSTRPPPREDATRHDAATAAQDSAPKTAPARQKRGATGHRSRAQRAAQTTPPTGKSSPRRATRSMATTLTERPKRPPAPTGANRPTKPRKAQRAWKRPRTSRTQGVVGSKPLGDGGLQAPKIPEDPVDFR